MKSRPLNMPQLVLALVSLGGCLLIKGHPLPAALAVLIVVAVQFSPFRLSLDRKGELRLVFLPSIFLFAYVIQVLSRPLGMQDELEAILDGLTYFFGAWLLLKMLIPKGFVARNDLKAIFLRIWLGRFRDRSIQGGFYNPLYVFSVIWLLAASQGSGRLHFALLALSATAVVLWDVLSRETEDGKLHLPVLLNGLFIRGAVLAACLAAAIALFLPWAHKTIEERYIAYLRGSTSGSVLERRTAIGEIGRLKLSKKVVMRVFTDSPGYLRDGVFTFYHQGMWLSPKMKPRAVKPAEDASSKPPGLFYLLRKAPEGAELFRMNIICLAPKNRALATPKGVVGVWVGEPDLKLLPGRVPVFPEKIERYRYSLTYTPDVRPEPMGEGEEKSVLRLPREFSSRLKVLTRDIVKNKKTLLAKIGAVHSFLGSRFTYSLEQKELRGNPLEHFLLRSRAGHCEYFASSMALMLRHLGIPTRYVTGYIVKEHNDPGGYYVVRQRDAHSWLEAYIRGRGWVALDPTPASGLTHPLEPRWRRVLAQWADLVGHRWQDWRLETQDKTFFEILKGLYGNHPALGILLAAALTLIFGYRLVALVRGGLLARGLSRKERARRRTPREAVAGSPRVRELGTLYSRFEAGFAKRAGNRLPFETPMEFSARALKGQFTEEEAAHFSEVVQTYCLLRYKPGVLDQGSLEDFQRLVEALE